MRRLGFARPNVEYLPLDHVALVAHAGGGATTAMLAVIGGVRSTAMSG